MSRVRDDGLSIAVWENSPWRSFIRFRDPVDEEGQAESQLSRPLKDVSQALQQESDDVREIFGRALDVARSKKSFASFTSVTNVRKDVMRSEARLMAEDNRSWGVAGRSKGHHRADDSSDDLDDDDDDKGEDAAPAAEAVSSPRQPAENAPGTLSHNSSVRVAPTPPPNLRRGTAMGVGGVEDADAHGAAEWASASPASSRPPTRLQVLTAGGGELQPQTSLQTRNSYGPQSGATSPLADVGSPSGGIGSPGLGAFGSSSARARAARAAATAAHGGGSVGTKLLHVQAAHMPVRQSMEMHASRKVLSPTGAPPTRRSNSFDGSRHDGAALAVGGDGGAGAGPMNDPALVHIFRDRRATTATGSSSAASVPTGVHGSTGIPRRGSGGGGMGSGGGYDNQQHPASQQQQMLRTAASNRSRRTALLVGEDRRSYGSEGSASKGPVLATSPSGRLPDPFATRLHTAQRTSKASAAGLAAAGAGAGAQGDQRLPRTASNSYSQFALQQSLDVRRHTPLSVSSADYGRYGGPPPGSSGSLSAEGRGIMGRLKGFFSQQ